MESANNLDDVQDKDQARINLELLSETEINTLLDNKVNKNISITQKTADFTLTLTNIRQLIEMNATLNNTITIPLNSTVAFPIGTKIKFVQLKSAITTRIQGAVGVTVLSLNNLNEISTQYAYCTLIKRATNQWHLNGTLS